MGNINNVQIGGNANGAVIQSENTVIVSRTEQKKSSGFFSRLIALLKNLLK